MSLISTVARENGFSFMVFHLFHVVSFGHITFNKCEDKFKDGTEIMDQSKISFFLYLFFKFVHSLMHTDTISLFRRRSYSFLLCTIATS